MNTKRITTELDEAAALLREGKLVAVPTETVYGLAGNGLDVDAVEQIYEVKGRPAVKPLSLMVSGKESIAVVCSDVPPAANELAERFWPGPLTIVLKAKPLVPEIVRAGGSTVGLRCPDHPATLETLRLAGVPFAAPSANSSGAPSPKTADEVLRYFDGRIAAVIDGGLRRAIAMASSGNTKTVVWNPGPEGKLPDFEPDDWRKFVCVEPVTSWPKAERALGPGETHELAVAIQSVAEEAPGSAQ
jgi:L-threonylcarbamoyladenylate synthase